MTAMPRAEAWSTAVPDWRTRIMQGQSLIPDLPLHDAVAEKALRIFKRLRVPDMIGYPSYGEVCDQWVFDLVRAIFGSYDPETRRRMLQEFFLLIPKKNAKSSSAAGIIVTAAILNDRPNAEAVLIAPTHKIAEIAFKQARLIIALDEDLKTIFHVQAHLKKITHRFTGCEIMILSADRDIVTGSKATYVLIDETHVLGMKAKAPEIFTELRGGLAARPEGFLLQITTQSKSQPAGQFRAELQKARDVRDGRRDSPMLAVLYELPPEEAKAGIWRDEATWHLVNPNLGRSVDLEWLRTNFAQAVDDGPAALALFASQHLNVEIGLGLHSERWIGADYWPSNAQAGLTLGELIETSDVAVVGADVGGADDLFGLGVIGRHAETRVWQAWVRAWCLPGVLDRRKEIAPRLRDFATDGDLVIAAQASEHVVAAVDICERLRTAKLLPTERAIGLDPWGVAALRDELEARGFTDDEIIGVGQGYKLSGAIKGLERRLADGRFKHGDQPLFNWCLGNAKAEARGMNVYITKERAGVSKIDPLVAIFNAAMLMDLNPEPRRARLIHIGPDYRAVA